VTLPPSEPLQRSRRAPRCEWRRPARSSADESFTRGAPASRMSRATSAP